MPKPFEKWDWIYYKDLARCPFHPFTTDAVRWSHLQDDLLSFQALERYADYLLTTRSAEQIQCPVCGYYCLGKGGLGCIDKPSLQSDQT